MLYPEKSLRSPSFVCFVYVSQETELGALSHQAADNSMKERLMWDMLENKLEMSPDDLFCCCGQFSVPKKKSA